MVIWANKLDLARLRRPSGAGTFALATLNGLHGCIEKERF